MLQLPPPPPPSPHGMGQIGDLTGMGINPILKPVLDKRNAGSAWPWDCRSLVISLLYDFERKRSVRYYRLMKKKMTKRPAGIRTVAANLSLIGRWKILSLHYYNWTGHSAKLALVNGAILWTGNKVEIPFPIITTLKEGKEWIPTTGEKKTKLTPGVSLI